MTAKSLPCCLALALVWASACNDDEDRAKTPSDSRGGARAAGAGGTGREAGGTESLAPGGSSSAGGTLTPEGGATSAGQGPGNEAGMKAVTEGGAGGASSPYSGVEKLSLCPRLDRELDVASTVTISFDFEVYSDPCVGWTTSLYLVEKARPSYLNVLKAWNPGFWGCKDAGVETFALLWKQPDVLTRGDLDRLITLYIQVLDRDLELRSQAGLSPAEIAEMRAALERLGQGMVTDPTLDFSHPECLLPPAGEGGAGGDGATQAGAGGQLSSGSGGYGGH